MIVRAASGTFSRPDVCVCVRLSPELSQRYQCVSNMRFGPANPASPHQAEPLSVGAA